MRMLPSSSSTFVSSGERTRCIADHSWRGYCGPRYVRRFGSCRGSSRREYRFSTMCWGLRCVLATLSGLDPDLWVLIIPTRVPYLLVGFHLGYQGCFGSTWTEVVGSWPGDRECCSASISFWCFWDLSLWVVFHCNSLDWINPRYQCIVGLYSSIRSIFHNLREGVGGGSFSCADNSLYWGTLTKNLTGGGELGNYSLGHSISVAGTRNIRRRELSTCIVYE